MKYRNKQITYGSGAAGAAGSITWLAGQFGVHVPIEAATVIATVLGMVVNHFTKSDIPAEPVVDRKITASVSEKQDK